MKATSMFARILIAGALSVARQENLFAAERQHVAVPADLV
jgi:hypothetical protein